MGIVLEPPVDSLANRIAVREVLDHPSPILALVGSVEDYESAAQRLGAKGVEDGFWAHSGCNLAIAGTPMSVLSGGTDKGAEVRALPGKSPVRGSPHPGQLVEVGFERSAEVEAASISRKNSSARSATSTSSCGGKSTHSWAREVTTSGHRIGTEGDALLPEVPDRSM